MNPEAIFPFAVLCVLIGAALTILVQLLAGWIRKNRDKK